MQDTRRRNLRKASRTAVGPVRRVRLNNLHKHSHGLLVSAGSPASDLELYLGLELLRNTALLIGDKAMEDTFSVFLVRTQVSYCPFQRCYAGCGKFEASQKAERREISYHSRQCGRGKSLPFYWINHFIFLTLGLRHSYGQDS